MYKRQYLSRVLVLPVRVADLKLPAGRTVIRYRLESYHFYLGDQPEKFVDALDPRRFDLAHPALELLDGKAGAPTVADQPGRLFTTRLDLLGYGTERPAGVLLLHPHNQADAQVEVLPMDYRWPNEFFMPTIAR